MSTAAGLGRGADATPSDVLRAMAHELRQPLSNIESIAYYLALVVPRAESKTHEHLLRIRELIEQSNWILSSGLQLACPPDISPAQVDLGEIITGAIASRPVNAKAALRMELSGGLPPVRLDPVQGRALVETLLTLFRQFGNAENPVRVCTSGASAGGTMLEIISTAPGYRSEASLGTGAALSLECARRIAQMHGASMECDVDPVRGVRVRVSLR